MLGPGGERQLGKREWHKVAPQAGRIVMIKSQAQELIRVGSNIPAPGGGKACQQVSYF